MPFLWNDPKSVDEIKHKLVCANLELRYAESEAQEEIIKNKETIRKLMELLENVCRERDEARNKLRMLTNTDTTPPNVEMGFGSSSSGCVSNMELDILVMTKPLPEKGKLMQAVAEAGPLLQSLLIEPLPKWQNHPPLQLPETPIREAALGLRPLPGSLVGESSGFSQIPSSSVLNFGRACLNGGRMKRKMNYDML